MEVHFEWDARKARANLRKHGVSFREAASVFFDPLAISIIDDKIQEADEERWITLGKTDRHYLVVVSHTWRDHEDGDVTVRLFSARRATISEIRQYEEGFTNAR